MNKLLELKGSFKYSKNQNNFGPISLPKDANKYPVTSDHIAKLIRQLELLYSYWEKNDLINGALITVYYREIVAKSNRLCRLLVGSSALNKDSIRGAKYDDTLSKHIFTYFTTLDLLSQTIDELKQAKNIVDIYYSGKVTKNDIDEINKKERRFFMATSIFTKIIRDAYFVENFDIERDSSNIKETSIITLYRTGIDTKSLLRKLGINLIDAKMLDDTTIRLSSDEFAILIEKAPYLISMKTNDLSKLKKEDVIKNDDECIFGIPKPTNEPVIGVIDTLFDKSVYFSDWVDYVDMVNESISDKKESENFFHGTAVSSIIVDGPSLNPNYDDGCGRFRVKHFGVAVGGYFSSFTILKCIRLAVKQNPEIKVWNLSLGSMMEINPNFISPEAAELDKIQSEYNVVFVVAGTNKPLEKKESIRIGAPADSINSIVVNSVNSKGEPASYHRVGPVLSFFYKPDVSYYGGDIGCGMRVCSTLGEYFVSGTSFAAPWIARKMAYLINVLGFNREVAKALLIDSAAGWHRKDKNTCDIGYGIVPINIKDIVSSSDDEIKFIFEGATDEYVTSAFNIPIPLNSDDYYPYITRATMCYYPHCSRNQGVDYTNTEIDFQFGRVKENSNGSVKLESFNGNRQGEAYDATREAAARANWRKWDNIKHISDWDKQSIRVKKSYEGKLCGVKMTVKERLTSTHKKIPFGIVITLKEINGVNRISDFIKRCEIKGWFVNQIDIEQRIEINNIANEEIDFE